MSGTECGEDDLEFIGCEDFTKISFLVIDY